MLGGIVMFVAVVASIMIHEAGHFVAARATGMKATEFFLGFGPRLWSVKRGETEYGIKAFPLGGYVRIAGMNPLDEVDPADAGRTYREKKFWQKTVVILAGVGLHFVIAYLVLFGAVLGLGVADPDQPLTEIASVQEVTEDGVPSPAAVAGINAGDVIVAVDGVAVEAWTDLQTALAERPEQQVEITVERDGVPVVLSTTLSYARDADGKPRLDADGDRIGYLGVYPSYGRERVGVITGAGVAGRAFIDMTGRTFAALGNLVRPSSLAQLGGAFFGDTDVPVEIRPVSPVGLVNLGAQSDLELMIVLVASVNIVLGIFNGLPLYPLDGGQFMVAVYERVTHREADVRKLAPIAAAVMALVIFLFTVALFLDIVNPIALPG